MNTTVKEAIVRFNTDDFPPKDRLDYWVGMVCENFMALDIVNMAKDGKFAARLAMSSTGLLKIFHVCGTPQIAIRRRASAIECTHAKYILVASLDQPWNLESVHGQFDMAAGDVALLDTSKPFFTQFHGETNVHIFDLARPWVHSWIGEATAQSTSRIDGSAEWGRVLYTLTKALTPEFAASESFSEELVVNHFGATLALATRSPSIQEKVSEGGLSSIVEGVFSIVEERYAEADLSAAKVALELQISERTLFRVLERNGHTFFGLLAHKRMAVARRLLLDRRDRKNISLNEVGRRVGYQHSSQFSRAFTKLQGMTPSQFRHSTSTINFDEIF